MKEKEKAGYVILEVESGGLDYRTIADIMTIDDKVMGHSTVRNMILSIMEKFAACLMASCGVVEDPMLVAKGPLFQKMVASFLQEIYSTGRRSEI